MNWTASVKSASKFLLANEFKIIESKDQGMGKHALLSNQVFQVVYLYDKGPVHCDLVTSFGSLDLIHLSNFLNGKQKKFEFPRIYWNNGHKDAHTDYISYYDQIIASEIEKITDFINTLTKEKSKEIKTYSGKENLKHLNKK